MNLENLKLPRTEKREKTSKTAKMIYFPNELNNRFHAAVPNRAWVADTTFLDVKITNEKRSPRLLVFMDVASRKIIAYQPFLVKNKGTIRGAYVVRVIEPAIIQLKNPKNELIIHSDRGVEFFNTNYYQLFLKYKFLIGSMSEFASPNQNAPVERVIRTIKTQLNSLTEPLPKEVESFYKLNLLIQRRIEDYNHQHKSRAFPRKESPANAHIALDKNKDKAPSTVIHWAQSPYYIDQTSLEITKYQKEAIIAFQDQKATQLAKTILDTNQDVQVIKQQIQQLQVVENYNREVLLEEVRNQGNQIKQLLLQQKRRKSADRKELPLRQPAGSSVYNYLMSLQKPKKVTRRVWARNKLCITLLRYLGLRAGEIQQISKLQIQTACRERKIEIFQPKTKTRRIVVFPHAAIKALADMPQIVNDAFISGKPELPLGQSEKQNSKVGLINKKKWIIVLNRFIKLANREFPGIYSSHSFRINMVTRLLRAKPIHEVKAIIGHKDIRTTSRYDRYVPALEEVISVIDRALHEADIEE